MSVEAISWALNLAPAPHERGGVIAPCDPDTVAARIKRGPAATGLGPEPEPARDDLDETKPVSRA